MKANSFRKMPELCSMSENKDNLKAAETEAQAPNPQTRTELGEYGEFGLIEHLTKNFEIKHGLTVKGVGDDAAVIDNEGKLTVVSTDLLLEGVHFDLMYVPLKHLGYKAVIVNLSDIFAMNATPRQITVSIGVSNRISVEALEELYEGIHHACERYNIDLVGGDTTSSVKGLVISITAIGEVQETDVVYRNTAKAGDLVCVSGDLGAAFLGLQILEREKRLFLENPAIKPDLENQKYLVGRQLKPEARADLIKMFGEAKLKPTAMMDISDGLSSDIMHICRQSEVGAIIREADVPISENAYNMALKFNLDPINCALNGGEDYELLFTVDPSQREILDTIGDIAIVGDILEKAEGTKLETKNGNRFDLVAGGWNSLAK